MHERTIGIASIGALALAGCQGVLWGNLAVFALSVGIFMGTLSLGRR